MPMISRLEVGRARARMPRSLILAPTRELAAQVAQSFEKYGKNHKLVGRAADRRRLDGRPDRQARSRRRRADRDTRPPARPFRARPHHADGRRDPRHRRGRPHARHGLHPRHREDLQAAAAEAPDAVLLGHHAARDHAPRRPVPDRSRAHRGGPPGDHGGDHHAALRVLPGRRGLGQARGAARADQVAANVKNAIIFCNRKRDVAILLKSLLKHGFNAGALHGDMDQIEPHGDAGQVPRRRDHCCWPPPTSPPAASTSPTSATSSTSTCPGRPTTTCTASAARAAPASEGFSATLVTLDDIKAIQEIEKITGEAPVWLGEPPSAEDLAEGATRKRRRGKAPAAGGRRVGQSAGERSSGDRRPSRERAPRRAIGRQQPMQDRATVTQSTPAQPFTKAVPKAASAAAIAVTAAPRVAARARAAASRATEPHRDKASDAPRADAPQPTHPALVISRVRMPRRRRDERPSARTTRASAERRLTTCRPSGTDRARGR